VTATETPFLEVLEDIAGESPLVDAAAAETPFLSQYFAGEGAAQDAAARQLEELLTDLHDEDFDQAVSNLIEHAQARADLLVADAGMHPRHAEQTLNRYFQPLADEAETVLSQLAEAVERAERSGISGLSAADLDDVLTRAEITTFRSDPLFEDFLGSLLKKAKSLAKGAVKLAAKGAAAVSKVLPAGILLRQLVRLVRPMLDRVVRLALDRLPPELRAPAALLAKRLLGSAGRTVTGALPRTEATAEGADEAESPESPASAEIGTIQQELNMRALGLMLASSPAEQELLLADSVLDGRAAEDFSLLELDSARARFADGLARLQEGEDPTPLVEQFLPAIMPVLKTALSIIGRDRVVRFLAGHLGRLIAPMVGPQITPALSRAIVDAGMRMMMLEAEDSSGAEIGAETGVAGGRAPSYDAVISLLEDTVADVAQHLADEDVEVHALLEAEALAAFGRAARSAFPARVLRGPRPRRHHAGTWVAMPARGPRRYRKYSRVLDVEISASAAEGIVTRSGRTLATVLRDRLGHDGSVRARLHLYQAIPGTTYGRIARTEPVVQGGPGAEPAAQLLPLTRQAAATLLGDPEMGRDVSEQFLGDGPATAVGQRLYALEVVDGGGRLAGRPGAVALSGVTVRDNAAAGTTTITLRLSEALAQTLAAQARAKRPITATLALLQHVYGPGLRTAAGGRRAHWRLAVRRVLAVQLPARRDELTTAAAAPEDGITILMQWQGGHPLDLVIAAGRRDA
jgi:hypothetical protein